MGMLSSFFQGARGRSYLGRLGNKIVRDVVCEGESQEEILTLVFAAG